jgi:hypothetical protein
VSESNSQFFLSIFRELGNSDLYFSILEHFNGGPTISNVVERFYLHDEFGSPCPAEVQFAASHFRELPHSVLLSLNVSHFHAILSSPSLVVNEEDSLYNFIYERFEGDRHADANGLWTSLLDFLRFESMRTETIATFLAETPNVSELLTPWLLRVFGDRLIHEVMLDNDESFPPKKIREGTVTEISLNNGRPFNGIIAYLTHKHGRNVHAHGIIDITAATHLPGGEPKNLCDLDSESEYLSSSTYGANQSVCWDFKGMRIRPTHYTLRSGTMDFPQSWIMDGSIDGNNWSEIDRRTGIRDLVWRSAIQSFPVSNSIECRFIRLTQSGPNYDYHNDVFVLSGVEFFGSLTE